MPAKNENIRRVSDYEMLEEDFEYYDAHQEEIVENNLGKWVVIKNLRVRGYFETEDAALEAMKHEELGTFLVKLCQNPGEDIVNYYNEAVAFA